MNPYDFPPIAAVIDAAYGLLDWIAALLEPIAGSAAAALAVVALTLAVRTALIPAAVAQARAERGRLRLAPKVAELQRRHGRDRERLQRELMALYARERTSPFAGCLPGLLQAPVVSVVYALFILPVINGHPNELLTETLFGVPLGSSFAHAVTTASLDPSLAVVTGGLMAVALIVGELTRRMMRAEATARAASAPTAGALRPSAPAPAAPAVPGMPDPAAMARIASFLPFLTAFIVPFVPVAAGLYLAVTVTWTLGQRPVLRRLVIDPPARGGAVAPAA